MAEATRSQKTDTVSGAPAGVCSRLAQATRVAIAEEEGGVRLEQHFSVRSQELSGASNPEAASAIGPPRLSGATKTQSPKVARATAFAKEASERRESLPERRCKDISAAWALSTLMLVWLILVSAGILSILLAWTAIRAVESADRAGALIRHAVRELSSKCSVAANEDELWRCEEAANHQPAVQTTNKCFYSFVPTVWQPHAGSERLPAEKNELNADGGSASTPPTPQSEDTPQVMGTQPLASRFACMALSTAKKILRFPFVAVKRVSAWARKLSCDTCASPGVRSASNEYQHEAVNSTDGHFETRSNNLFPALYDLSIAAERVREFTSSIVTLGTVTFLISGVGALSLSSIIISTHAGRQWMAWTLMQTALAGVTTLGVVCVLQPRYVWALDINVRST
ncbi:hypothetical protein BESB_078120 [Besnoitia besnoiti]|uniref:Transmembrane protein n=1 Tax=Besnoitia besnoiti TaxID=94643 RepID=A0A2A9MCE1_BESBE|nr:hypothetical protein BESB_078120 [Besnoitia besnoiti]PFH33596.1 hypothetical protein BESB_078120 [Besnoitia besnoiti]